MPWIAEQCLFRATCRAPCSGMTTPKDDRLNDRLKDTSSASPRFPFGDGNVICDPADGAPIRIEHPARPKQNLLFDERDADFHQTSFAWGKGFAIADGGSGRWDDPRHISVQGDRIVSHYDVLPGLQLQITRIFGAHWRETYRWTNTHTAPLTITSLAVSAPFRDQYRGARESLTHDCHAHIWAGGSFSYVWATPMHGQPPFLGLAVTDGALWSYSIETRNAYTGHTRGHIYLHVTDAARAPHALGGQPSIALAPGASYELGWTIGWFGDWAQFERELLKPPFHIPTLAAPVGGDLTIDMRVPNATIRAASHVTITQTATTVIVRSEQSGVHHLDIEADGRQARIGVLFHRSLREIVEQRVRFILDHQRASERDDERRGAFLPFDQRWGLRVNKGNWLDWSDGRERLAMPLLLQQARARGWGDPAEIDAALHEFTRFARRHLVDDDGAVFEDSFRRQPRRLYNFPWLAMFFLTQWTLYHSADDLEQATRIIEHYYAAGGSRFMAIGISEIVEALIEHLNETGQTARARQLIQSLIDHAEYFVHLGSDLPVHEVSYEQSIVAPLLLLLLAAQRHAPAPRYERALRDRLPWLLAFAGSQPHVRLRNVAIRHWDGYWFGAYRQWGDVFPHYWSVLSAPVLAQWPSSLGEPIEQYRAMASDIFRANLADYKDDGSATCAFIYPGCVDGNPAHHADPLLNDQDWALVYYLRYEHLLNTVRTQE